VPGRFTDFPCDGFVMPWTRIRSQGATEGRDQARTERPRHHKFAARQFPAKCKAPGDAPDARTRENYSGRKRPVQIEDSSFSMRSPVASATPSGPAAKLAGNSDGGTRSSPGAW
jgi:hypothetical protein